MTKINGQLIEQVDDVGEGMRIGRGSRRFTRGLGPLMDAGCNAFFLRNGLPKSEHGGFKGLIKGHATAAKSAKERR